MMIKNARSTKIEVHTDCKLVVDQINSCNDYDYNITTIMEGIQELRAGFKSCSFFFVPRSKNQISHTLGQFAVKLVHDVDWE